MEQGEIHVVLEGVEVELQEGRSEEEGQNKLDHGDELSLNNNFISNPKKLEQEKNGKRIEAHVKVPKRRRDGGVWPSLYDECMNLVSSAILMYALADIRQAIRKGKVDDPLVCELFMTLPLDVEKAMPIMDERKQLFAHFLGEDQSIRDDEGNEVYPYLELLLTKREINQIRLQREQRQSKGSKYENDDKYGYEIVEIHDEKAGEIVYSIDLNHHRQWIEVCFRGSVTARDFLADVDPLMEFFPNPVHSIRGHPQNKTIGIHSGFTSYLNGTFAKLGTGKSKQIKDSVLEFQKQYPHYRIYVTGHSLGGALATLMTFELATTDEIIKPVTCISVAAPMAGNIDFRHAFQALEKMGHVRCVRVANRLDIITGLPTRVCWCCDVCCCCCCCWMAAIQSRRYWHVGAQVVLGGNGTCDISYERPSMSYREQLAHEFSSRGTVSRTFRKLFETGSCGFGEGDFLRNHSCKEYIERMEAAKDVLNTRNLQQLYFRQARYSINSQRDAPPLGSMSDLIKDIAALEQRQQQQQQQQQAPSPTPSLSPAPLVRLTHISAGTF